MSISSKLRPAPKESLGSEKKRKALSTRACPLSWKGRGGRSGGLVGPWAHEGLHGCVRAACGKPSTCSNPCNCASRRSDPAGGSRYLRRTLTCTLHRELRRLWCWLWCLVRRELLGRRTVHCEGCRGLGLHSKPGSGEGGTGGAGPDKHRIETGQRERKLAGGLSGSIQWVTTAWRPIPLPSANAGYVCTTSHNIAEAVLITDLASSAATPKAGVRCGASTATAPWRIAATLRASFSASGLEY